MQYVDKILTTSFVRKRWVVLSVSMRKPGRTRQEMIQLKSPISLKLGTNVGFGKKIL